MVGVHNALAHLWDMRSRALMCMRGSSGRLERRAKEVWNLRHLIVWRLVRMPTTACLCRMAAFEMLSVE
jgi:hypothetical protein